MSVNLRPTCVLHRLAAKMTTFCILGHLISISQATAEKKCIYTAPENSDDYDRLFPRHEIESNQVGVAFMKFIQDTQPMIMEQSDANDSKILNEMLNPDPNNPLEIRFYAHLKKIDLENDQPYICDFGASAGSKRSFFVDTSAY